MTPRAHISASYCCVTSYTRQSGLYDLSSHKFYGHEPDAQLSGLTQGLSIAALQVLTEAVAMAKLRWEKVCTRLLTKHWHNCCETGFSQALNS